MRGFVDVFDDAFEHQVRGDAIIARRRFAAGSLERVDAQVGEKAELAEVDAEDRNLAIAHLPGGPEDGPVAAEDERDVGVFATQIGGAIEIEDDDLAELFESRHEPLRLFADARLIRIAEDVEPHLLRRIARDAPFPRHRRRRGPRRIRGRALGATAAHEPRHIQTQVGQQFATLAVLDEPIRQAEPNDAARIQAGGVGRLEHRRAEPAFDRPLFDGDDDRHLFDGPQDRVAVERLAEASIDDADVHAFFARASRPPSRRSGTTCRRR